MTRSRKGHKSKTASGMPMLEYKDTASENGAPFQMTTFIVAKDLPSKQLIVAIFTWTVEQRFRQLPRNENDLVLVRNAVARMSFNENNTFRKATGGY